MSQFPSIAFWVFVSFCVAWGIYDVFANWKWGNTGTLSYEIIHVSWNYPVVPFIAGVLMGHLFWNQDMTRP